MSNKTTFDVEKIRKSINEWTNNDVQKKLFFKRSIEKIQSFIDDKYDNAGVVAGNLDRLSTWYFNLGVSDVLSQKESGLNNIIISSIYNYWYICITYEFIVKIIKKPTLVYNDTGLSLARMLSLGLFNHSSKISKVIIDGVTNGVFIGLSNNAITPFIIQLYLKWQEVGLSEQQYNLFKLSGMYQQIINNLRSTDLESVSKVLENACTYHVSRSKYNTNKEFFEFSVERYMIYPVEILSVLKIREQLGLANPNIRHELMGNSICKLPSSIDIPDLPLVDELLNKPIIKDLVGGYL